MRYGKYVIFHENKLFTCNCDSKEKAKSLAGKYWGLTEKETEKLTVTVPEIIELS